MSLKAKLKVQLLANDVTVAESEDEHLWRRVLASIQGVASTSEDQDEEEDREERGEVLRRRRATGRGAVAQLARDLNVTSEELEGACSPEREAPFIHLDEKNWETFKRNVPSRGPTSVAPSQLAATLLCLWFRYAGLEGQPTTAQAQSVLATIGERDRNAARAIRNCEWLQTRAGGIRINAARHSRALAIARAYVGQSEISSQ